MLVNWTLVYAADAPLQRVEATQVRLACRAVVSQGPHTKTTSGTAFCPVSLLPVAWTGEPVALLILLWHQIISTMLHIHHVLPQLISDIDVFWQTINFPVL